MLSKIIGAVLFYFVFCQLSAAVSAETVTTVDDIENLAKNLTAQTPFCQEVTKEREEMQKKVAHLVQCLFDIVKKSRAGTLAQEDRDAVNKELIDVGQLLRVLDAHEDVARNLGLWYTQKFNELAAAKLE